jgi:hypothetical protein
LTAWLAVLLGLAAVPGLQATVLDGFIGPKAGWTDTLNGGSILQSGGEFTVTTANPGGSLTYSKKTSNSFTNASGHTLEFRVNVDSVTPGTANTNPLAILAWVPAGGAVLASGYSVSVGAADVIIQKGGATLYATNFTAAGTNLQNANITIALRMTSSGSAVTVNARVYKRIANGLIAQYFTTLFEHTVVDSSGLIGGAGGNAALGVKNQASVSGAAAAFSNLQVFDTITTVLDTFSSGTLDTTKWTVYKKNSGLGDSVTVGPSGLDILATIADPSGGFAALYTANTTYTIVDGGQVEFQLDIVNNLTGDANGYSALGYLPAANPTYINGIIEYHVAHDIIGHTLVVNGKGYNEWWGGRNDIQPPYTPPGCRYILTMTGEGSNCRIETRIEDLSVADVNDPARLVWQTEFVDTPAADPGLNEASLGNPAPYLNSPDGRFAISTFNAGAVPVAYGGASPNWAEIIYSNAVVRQTLPGKTAPILANVAPAYSANFLPSATVVSFDASDAANLPLSGLSITLNGVTYANGSPGVTITPSGSTSTTRHFALAGALTANVNYVGSVQATDANGLSASFPLVFDTFLTNDYVIEAEEFNVSTNGGVSGGAFIDNPVLIADGTSDPNAYNGQPGLAEVDFHDNRGPWTGVQDANHTFRWNDSVYTSHSSDPARAKYANAGGITAGFYETEVTDIYDGDWLNYTHTYPAGTYKVFLRQATFKVLGSLVTLERVTSDPTTIDQTASVLGSFLGTPTGIGLFVNVPLTDGAGNSNLVLRLSGSQDTLRLMNRVTGNADLDVGSLEQNYLVLVPVADPGTLRPVVSMVSPAPNAILGANSPNTGASIANRDTFVDMSTIALTINGVSVPISGLVSNLNGISFTWTPTGLPPSLALTNTVTFKDNVGVQQSFTWTYSYASILNASASLPVGSLSVRGFDARMVQSSAANMGGSGGLSSSVASAQAVLAIPPSYAVDLTSTNIVQTVAWDLNPPGGYGATANFPGLCQPPANINSFAIETFAYLQLTAGPHRFSVNSDDAVGIYSGANLADMSIVLVENNGVTHAVFEFFVPVDGLYPFHIIYQEGGGSAYLVLNSVDLSSGSTNLVNTAGSVNAYYPFVCRSSTSLAGPYAVDVAANAGNVLTMADVPCDGSGAALNQTLTGGTLTVPVVGSAKFYRLDGPRQSKITGITKSGSNVVITYQAQ